jgi:hypothetical protein
VLTELVYP